MSDLRAEVANALYWDLAIPRYRATSEVDHGLVTLQGVVHTGLPKVLRGGDCASGTRRDWRQE